eukprot:4497852-Pleurochrysis_carterae.AAC.1
MERLTMEHLTILAPDPPRNVDKGDISRSDNLRICRVSSPVHARHIMANLVKRSIQPCYFKDISWNSRMASYTSLAS